MTTFSVRVGFATHEDFRKGITVAGAHTVIVQTDFASQAAQDAAQIVMATNPAVMATGTFVRRIK